MPLDSYYNLKAEIAAWLNADDLDDRIDTFIGLAEARHKQSIIGEGGDILCGPILIREMLARAQATLDDRYLALPARFLKMKTLRVLTDPVREPAEISLHEMNKRRSSAAGPPRAFTVHEEIELDRPPDQAYAAEMIYYAFAQPLSASNQTNAILARSPDAYLYGSLAAASPFLLDDDLAKWDRLYVQTHIGLSSADRRGRHGGNLAARVAGSTP